jgi:hypothetical protein
MLNLSALNNYCISFSFFLLNTKLFYIIYFSYWMLKLNFMKRLLIKYTNMHTNILAAFLFFLTHLLFLSTLIFFFFKLPSYLCFISIIISSHICWLYLQDNVYMWWINKVLVSSVCVHLTSSSSDWLPVSIRFTLPLGEKSDECTRHNDFRGKHCIQKRPSNHLI